MKEKPEIVQLTEDVSHSPLYSEDLAPVPPEKRTWSMWNLAALWVGMAVCIPTYLLASYMVKGGLAWYEALIIIGLANLVITIPMVLNGHAGVKYGIPFPVLGRAAFGIYGIHIPSIVRGFVACGWFGVQTWIGGLAFYAIWQALASIITGNPVVIEDGLVFGKFVGFAVFWFINMYFIWKGSESIRWLEEWSAPILIIMGVLLIAWGATQAGGFGIVLEQSKQVEQPAAVLTPVSGSPGNFTLTVHPITDKEGNVKATHIRAAKIAVHDTVFGSWLPVGAIQESTALPSYFSTSDDFALNTDYEQIIIQAKKESEPIIAGTAWASATVSDGHEMTVGERIWNYILWLTIMVGFWATMSLSIADITRYAASQKAQVGGQFIGLPGTMISYSFVGVFVTCAAIINFDDVLLASDAPWDPVSLLSRFSNPWVVVISQIFMIIATLSTNIAANVIAPANAFSNVWPKRLSFRGGGIVTGIIGIVICPWWLISDISNILIFVSGLLGPVLGILIADYYVLNNKTLQLAELYNTNGIYRYGNSGFNANALIAVVAGVAVALVGFYVPAVDFLFKLSWFSGFAVSFVGYIVLARMRKTAN